MLCLRIDTRGWCRQRLTLSVMWSSWGGRIGLFVCLFVLFFRSLSAVVLSCHFFRRHLFCCLREVWKAVVKGGWGGGCWATRVVFSLSQSFLTDFSGNSHKMLKSSEKPYSSEPIVYPDFVIVNVLKKETQLWSVDSMWVTIQCSSSVGCVLG